ncbi:MAG: ABC transporter substrate-binding protein, partial [Microcystaceae cyanobacterium]
MKGRSPTKSPPQRLTPIRLQLKWKHQFQFAGYYAAQAKGYYRQVGLDVTLIEAPADIEPAQLVLQGKAEFGIANSDILLLRAKGNPV